MLINTTSIAFIFLGIGLTFCGWRFFRAFKKSGDQQKGNRIGFLLAMFLFMFAFQNGIILGLGTLLFANNPKNLFFILILANLFLALIAMFGVYVAYFIFAPRSSPLLPILIIALLSVIISVITFVDHPQPLINARNGIDWNISFRLSLSVFYLLLISIGTQFYIFIRLFFLTRIREIKFFHYFYPSSQ